MKYTGIRSSNELQWLDLKIGHRDSGLSNGHRQGDMYSISLLLKFDVFSIVDNVGMSRKAR